MPEGVSEAWADFDNDGDQDVLLSGQVEVLCAITAGSSRTSPRRAASMTLRHLQRGHERWARADRDRDLDRL